MEEYASNLSKIPKRIREGEMQPSLSLMQKAYLDLLLNLDCYSKRPTSRYKTEAMDDFMNLFSKAMTTSGVSAIFPTYPKQINEMRKKILQEWRLRANRSEEVLVSAPLVYEDFGQVKEIVEEFKLREQEKQKFRNRDKQQGEEAPSL